MNPFSLASLILVFSCFFLNVVLLRSRKSLIVRTWTFFNFAVGWWGLSAFFIGRSQNITNVTIWWRLAHIGIAFIPVFLLHNALLFCNKKRKFVLVFVYIQAFLFVICALTGNHLFIKNFRPFYDFYYITGGPLYYVFFSIWAFIVFYAHIHLYLKFKTAHGLEKNQIKYYFVGVLFGFSGGITNFLPVFNINFYPFGNFTIPLYCVVVTYAILKYRLLDISLIITRTGIFIFVYIFVLGIPFALGFGLYEELVKNFGKNWWSVPLIVSTVLATAGPFLYLYIEKKAENRLLKEQKSYQNVLRSASSGMIRIKDLFRLLSLIVRVVTKTVRIRHADIYLLDKETGIFLMMATRGRNIGDFRGVCIKVLSPVVQRLMEHREPIWAEEIFMNLQENCNDNNLIQFVDQIKELKASLIVPSFVEDKLIGILVLGEKKSKKPYSQDDLVVFSVLANQAALAIENAQFYNEIKKTHEQLFQAEKLATIGTMADGLSHQVNNRFHALSLISGDSLDVLRSLDISHCDEGVVKAINDVKSGLERIQANVLQGGEVVRGLLKYSRPGEAGFEPIDLKDIISGALDMVQYKIKLKEIDLGKNIPDNLPKLRGNLTQLQEVFFNMFDNAYDAIKERQIFLKEEGYKGKIEVFASLDDGNLKVVVLDNGMGVKDKDKKSLFTPFFTTKATARKGTGLGLYVIEKIITAHNGKLLMDSTYQTGTQFTVILPLSGPR